MNEVRVSEGGRVVIPAELRAKYGIAIGDTVFWHEDAHGLSLMSRGAGIRKAQAIAARYARPGVSVVDEFLRDKREEAQREDGAVLVLAEPAPAQPRSPRRRK